MYLQKKVGEMSADIDIDVPDRDGVLKLISHVRASVRTGSSTKLHNSGIYVTEIPYDPINQCAAIDYQVADERGYFKIDLLNQSVYQLVKDADHLDASLAKQPDWPRLWTDPDWAAQLVHVGNYTGLINQLRPDSIPRMAALISIIRPGKSHLQSRSWPEIFDSVWDGDNSKGFVFKKSHAISYAQLVALHMNLLD
jgi:hypothetical protein